MNLWKVLSSSPLNLKREKNVTYEKILDVNNLPQIICYFYINVSDKFGFHNYVLICMGFSLLQLVDN